MSAARRLGVPLLLTAALFCSAAAAGDFAIPDVDIERVRKVSGLAGMADKCGLDWSDYRIAFLARERQKPWTEEQIAFIDTLFDAGLRLAADSLPNSFCTSKRIERISIFMEQRQHEWTEKASAPDRDKKAPAQ